MTIRERRGALEGQTLCFIGDGCSMSQQPHRGLSAGGHEGPLRLPAGLPPCRRRADVCPRVRRKVPAPDRPRRGRQGRRRCGDGCLEYRPRHPREREPSAGFRGISGHESAHEQGKIRRPAAPLSARSPRREEISTAVFEAHADEIFTEAENRLHVQKAVLAVLLANQ